MQQLEGIVGLEATNHVAEQIANGEDTTKDLDFNSTYSIWTSGANWFNYLQKASEKVKEIYAIWCCLYKAERLKNPSSHLTI